MQRWHYEHSHVSVLQHSAHLSGPRAIVRLTVWLELGHSHNSLCEDFVSRLHQPHVRCWVAPPLSAFCAKCLTCLTDPVGLITSSRPQLQGTLVPSFPTLQPVPGRSRLTAVSKSRDSRRRRKTKAQCVCRFCTSARGKKAVRNDQPRP
jgi:hypothetical protein